MLSLGNGNYFFHIPRCGGNYTIRTIRGLRRSNKRPPLAHFGHMHGGPLLCDRTDVVNSFTTVRDPMSWYQSFYRFRIFKHYGKMEMDPGHPLDFYIWEKAGGELFDFDYFLTRVAKQYPWGYVTQLFCLFLPFVTTFLWLPQLTESLPRLLADWGYDTPIALPPKPKNASPKDIPARCSNKTKEKILKTEQGLISYLRSLASNGHPYISNMEV